MMLCSLDNLKTFLGITDNSKDDVLTLLIKMESAKIEAFIGYQLSRMTNEDELHSVNGLQLLRLDNRPIQSVTECSIGDTEIDDYKVIPQYAKQGLLYRGSGWNGNFYTRGLTDDIFAGVFEVKVTYISGYYLPGDEGYTEGKSDSLPYDISTACMIAVSEAYQTKDNAGIASHSEGGISTTFAQSENNGLSKKVASMLEDYREIGVA